jgi:hypothetical protein
VVAAVSDRHSQAAVLFLVGAMALYLGGSDAALAYVKAGLQPLLVASGVILMGLGVAAVLRYRREQDGYQPQGSRVAWLLALPPLALVLIAPPALGAFAASRQATLPPPTNQTSPTDQPAAGADQALFPPLLPSSDGAAVPLTLAEYMVRDYEAPHTLAGVRIRLVGFVTPPATRARRLPPDPLCHQLLRGRRHRPQGHHQRRPGTPCPRHLAGGRGTLAAADRRRPGPAILRHTAAAGRGHPGDRATIPAVRERLPLLNRWPVPTWIDGLSGDT